MSSRAWRERDHPRKPRGDEGGRFVRRGDGPAAWAVKAAAPRSARGGDAMLAAGYWYQDGDGEHDDALIDFWIHGHSDTTDMVRNGAPGDRARIDALDRATAQPSTAPMTLYRGTSADLHQGDEWTDPGFTTTSADPDVAKAYVERKRPVVMELHVARGVGSAAIGRMPGESWEMTDLEESGEVLLQRGLHFRVTNRARRGGIEYWTVEVTR